MQTPIIIAIGFLLILEGMPYFLSPEKTKEYLEMIKAVPNNSLRTLGFCMMMAGLAVIYFFH